MTRIEARERQRLQGEFLNRFLHISPESTAMFERGMDALGIVERDEGALTIFGEHIADGAVPVIATNHISLFDGFVIAKLTQQAKLRSQGAVMSFDLVIAQSLAAGKQGDETDAYFTAVKPFLREFGTELDLSIPTQNDIHYREVKREKRDYLGDYLEAAPQEGKGFAIFPEGTVKGGRINPKTQEVNGMRAVRSENDMTKFIDAVRAKGRDVVVLLGGIEGTDQMISPDHLFPTDEIIRFILGYTDYPATTSPMRVTVAAPYLRRAGGEATDGKDIAQRIAQLLPPERRGVWA